MEGNNTILTEVNGAIGIITLNRPNDMNAVSLEMLNEIAYQVQEWDYDETIKCIVMKGNEGVFAAGIDMKDLSNEVAQQSLALKAWQDEFNKIINCSKPIITAVSGYALGLGCDVALAGDIVLASESTQIGYPELSIGIIPSFGGCSRLIHRIGKAKTSEMILTGKAMSSEEASACGLISRVVPLQDLFAEAIRVANRIASLPYQAVLQAKETLRQVENMNLQNGLELELKSCRLSMNTTDFANILSNFR
ncbi:MAG: enoyl-CoA hydratase/isomerase family protein [Alphaproteobacteria bacterium]|nr:enoyl-CoA hydratase/isomerase family protein [Alphaproteobacteria bacterium]